MITMKIDYNITRKKLNEYVIDLIYDILEKYADACLNVYNVEASVLKQKTRAVFNI